MSRHRTAAPHADPATLRKVTTAAVAGTVIECFDFAIYGFMAPIIAITFFPEGNCVVGLLQTFAIFAVAFAMRPVGGAYFGMTVAFVVALLTPETAGRPFRAAEGRRRRLPDAGTDVTVRA